MLEEEVDQVLLQQYVAYYQKEVPQYFRLSNGTLHHDHIPSQRGGIQGDALFLFSILSSTSSYTVKVIEPLAAKFKDMQVDIYRSTTTPSSLLTHWATLGRQPTSPRPRSASRTQELASLRAPAACATETPSASSTSTLSPLGRLASLAPHLPTPSPSADPADPPPPRPSAPSPPATSAPLPDINRGLPPPVPAWGCRRPHVLHGGRRLGRPRQGSRSRRPQLMVQQEGELLRWLHQEARHPGTLAHRTVQNRFCFALLRYCVRPSATPNAKLNHYFRIPPPSLTAEAADTADAHLAAAVLPQSPTTHTPAAAAFWHSTSISYQPGHRSPISPSAPAYTPQSQHPLPQQATEGVRASPPFALRTIAYHYHSPRRLPST